jgi:hypothetical integral membrane protein (TIGR02206 family)
MDRNLLHHVVEPGSITWWIMNLTLVLSGAILFALARSASDFRRIQLSKVLAWIMLFNFFINHAWNLWNGAWNAQNNLPLHLCGMAVFIAVLSLLLRKQLIYEFLILWGAGAVHSFLTPEITGGSGWYEHLEYSISHGGIILAGLYCTLILGMKPRSKSWIRVFLLTQLTLPVIALVNYLFEANYMYISQKPNADNPFIMGEWPWYILGLELALILHFFVFYHLHRWLHAKRSAWGFVSIQV